MTLDFLYVSLLLCLYFCPVDLALMTILTLPLDSLYLYHGYFPPSFRSNRLDSLRS